MRNNVLRGMTADQAEKEWSVVLRGRRVRLSLSFFMLTHLVGRILVGFGHGRPDSQASQTSSSPSQCASQKETGELRQLQIAYFRTGNLSWINREGPNFQADALMTVLL